MIDVRIKEKLGTLKKAPVGSHRTASMPVIDGEESMKLRILPMDNGSVDNQSVVIDREPLGDGNMVKQISDKYFLKEQTLLSADGLDSKNKEVVDLYVDTHYVDYMLNNVTNECMYEVGELKRRVQENADAIQRLLEAHEREQKWIQGQMYKTA